MQVIHERCAGLDVHKRTVVACVVCSQADGTVAAQVRTFGTMTAERAALARWLGDWQVERVALESSGVYWWPVVKLLEEVGQAVLLVNPHHMKAIPGRKTDVADSRWLADLLRHGVLRASFIPPAAIRPLRELTRERKALVRERTQAANRLQKVLESANIKLAGVVSDVLGASGRDMLTAIAAGESDPTALAARARGVLRKKAEQLKQALDGRVQPHHRLVIRTLVIRTLVIRTLLQHITFLEGVIEALDAELERHLAPFAEQMALLQTIPGVNWIAAATILAEIGVDMSCFPSAAHLASWAGVCPGNNQSGGNRRSGPTTDGNRWLRGLLGAVAWGAIRKQGTSFGARYRRLARRHNKQKAVMAIMHNLVVVIYYVLRDGVAYRELGPDYYQPLDPVRLARRHVQRLEQLGYAVTLAPQGAA